MKAGEEIVSTGVFKLRNGMASSIDNKLAPKPKLNPTACRHMSVRMKSFTDLFIRRPVLALVVSLVILIAGLAGDVHYAQRRGNIRAATSPSVTVTTVYVGASAELVRGFITTPLERAIAAADGIDYLQSKARRASRPSPRG